MTTLILVRHGQSEANLDKCFAGQTNPDLTQMGHEQAEALSTWIIENFKTDKIYSSDLIRAYNTAKPTSEKIDVPIIKSKALREINAGYWQGKTFDDIIDEFPVEYSVWLNNIGNAVCPGGESVEELLYRILTALRKIAKENPDKTVLVVTHATPIRVIQSYYENGSIEMMHNTPWVPNTSATVCEYEDEVLSFKLIGYDDFLNDLKSTLPNNV